MHNYIKGKQHGKRELVYTENKARLNDLQRKLSCPLVTTISTQAIWILSDFCKENSAPNGGF